MELPYIADLAVTKLGGVILRKRIHVQVRAIYGTSRRTIKRRQDVQQGALSRTRLSDDGEHSPFTHLERQILKEHQLRFA